MPYIGNQPYQGVIDSGNILNGSIDTVDLKDGSVTSAKLETIGGLTAGSYTTANITVDSKGRVTLASNGSGGVSSITGTADQITASASTGAITLSLPQSINTTSSPSFANITLTGEIRGPSTLIIDPTTVGDDTGIVRIRGDLQVDGTTTTINSTTLEVADLNITLAKNAANAAAATGAGITVAGANATLTYAAATDTWNVNKNILITPGTANGILYLNANKVTTTNSNLTFDGSNFKLTGSDNNNLIWSVNSNAGNQAIRIQANVAGLYLQGSGTVDALYITQSSATGYISFRPASDTEQMRLTSTGLGIGLGGSSPGTKLDIADSSGGAPSFRITNSVTSAWMRLVNTGGGNAFIDSNVGFAFRVGGSYTTAATLDSSGNLGLGVTPSAWVSSTGLQVQFATIEGRSSLPSFAEYAANSFSQSGTRKYIASDFASRYTQYQSAHYWFTAPSGFGYGTAATSLTSTQNGNSYTIVSAGTTDFTLIGAANNNVGTTFTKSGGTGTGTGTVSQNITFTQAMTLDASGNLSVNTTTARTKLFVASSNASDTITLGSVSGGFALSNLNTAYGTQFGSFSTGNGWIQVARMDGTPTAYNLCLQPSGGNVGIGTSSPGEKLTTSSSNSNTYTSGFSTQAIPLGTNLRMENTSSTTDAFTGIIFVPTSGSGQGQISYLGAISTSGGLASEIVFGRRSAATNYAESVRITSGGNVGIGTPSPTAKLHVTGTSGGGYQTSNKIILQRTDATLPTGSIEFQGSGGHTNPYWNILTDADVGNDFGVSYNGSKFLQILSNGKVGIGISSPAQTLDVKGVAGARFVSVASGTNPGADNGIHVGSYVKSVAKNTWTTMLQFQNREGCTVGRVYLGSSSSGWAGISIYRFYTFYGSTGVVVQEMTASRANAENITMQITTDNSDIHYLQVYWTDNGAAAGPVNIVLGYEILSAGRDSGANYELVPV